MNSEIIEELKQEELRYRGLYESKLHPRYILDGLKADVFELAITKIEDDGLQKTYLELKSQRDKFSQFADRLSHNLANAYGLVVSKLWKHYKKEVDLCENNNTERSY